MLIAPCYYVRFNYKWRWLHHQQKVNNSMNNVLRDVIPVMVLLEEMKKRVYLISTIQARVHCQVLTSDERPQCQASSFQGSRQEKRNNYSSSPNEWLTGGLSRFECGDTLLPIKNTHRMVKTQHICWKWEQGEWWYWNVTYCSTGVCAKPTRYYGSEYTQKLRVVLSDGSIHVCKYHAWRGLKTQIRHLSWT